MCIKIEPIDLDEACEFASRIANHPKIEFPEIPAICHESAQTFVFGCRDESHGSIIAVIWGLVLLRSVRVLGLSPNVSADVQKLLCRKVLYLSQQMGKEKCIWEVPGISAPDVVKADTTFPIENMEKLDKILGWRK